MAATMGAVSMGAVRLTRQHGGSLQAELEVHLVGYMVPRVTYITRLDSWTGSSDELRTLLWQRFCQSSWMIRMKEKP